ncbi:Calmodulin-related, putative isoform 2 [Quillaja saponaria]|uniref:Calmodulin-related, putative isoform 2 n=1 Tax=Quillaja saponaria TaxID=32244 RepID=A0AAD7L3K9_QUISA|nr:Calmodulin-related, putative isoform 2 [Quillaja saponaria]
MAKGDPSDTEAEETSDSSSAEEPDIPSNGQNQGVSEYEKQRLLRMAENRSRLEALGLPKIASSLMGPLQKAKDKKGKAKVEVDDDYRPDEGDAEFSSLSGEDRDDDDAEDEDFESGKASGTRKRKVKNKGSKPKNKVYVRKHSRDSDYIDDDDDALRQAISLSLQGSTEGSYCSQTLVLNNTLAERKGNSDNLQDKGRRKSKKSVSFTSRLQMTKDELILHFFQFDDKGSIAARDVQRIATAHDFTWTNQELASMIHCFDSDGDGKLTLDDFRNIAIRCNMLKDSENS